MTGQSPAPTESSRNRPPKQLFPILIGFLFALSARKASRKHPASRPPAAPKRAKSGERGPKEHSGNPAEPGRGRQAETPSEIPARGWKDIALRIFKEISKDRVLANAGSVTYFALLALFPAITSLVSFYGLFADRATINEHMSLLNGIFPSGGIEIVGEQLKRLTQKDEATLGFGFIFGLAVALWSANGGLKSLFDSLNVVYDEVEKRSFVRLNAISFAFTLGAIAFLLIAIGGVVVIPTLFTYVGVGSDTEEIILGVLRWPALLAIVSFGIALIYRYGPSRDKPKWRWISWGSATASVLWLCGSMLFSWYAENFGNYNETYGSLGAAIGFMTWLWMSSIVILLGAEINAEMEHQTARDTTVGAPKPLGARGATMADTIGTAQT